MTARAPKPSGRPDEAPILFSTSLVPSLMDRSKTQTRRTNGLAVINAFPNAWRFHHWGHDEHDRRMAVFLHTSGDTANVRCPFDAKRLWVREAWRPTLQHSHGMDACDCGDVLVTYRGDGAERFFPDGTIPDEWAWPKVAKGKQDVPSILMPRWACRTTIAGPLIRVERLHDISEADAKAEGAPLSAGNEDVLATAEWVRGLGRADATESYRRGFAWLWSQVNGPDSWRDNPHVWVVSWEPSAVEVRRG